MKSIQPHRIRSRHTLPPHTWEAHPVAQAGEANKTLVVVIISIAVIILLALLLFIGSRVVGKAIQYGTAPAQEAGIFIVEGAETAGESFTVPITATINTPSTGVTFTLSYAEGLTPDCSALQEVLDEQFTIDGEDLSVIKGYRCPTEEYANVPLSNIPPIGTNEIVFMYTGLCAPADRADTCPNALQGDNILLGEVTFTAVQPGEYDLDFISFDIIALEGANEDLINEGHDARIIVAAPETAAVPPPEPSPASSDSGASSGGGGSPSGLCAPRWECSNWNYCNATLEQSRICTDKNNCRDNTIQVQACSACQESWVCSEWSACQNNLQARTCVDEHYCGTVSQQPVVQKSCAVATVPGPVPARVVPPSQIPTVVQQPQPSAFSFQMVWKNYKGYLVVAVSILIALAVLLFVLMKVLKPKHLVYNFNDLKEWIKKELSMGTSRDEVRVILKQHTGWKDNEITAAFAELREGQPTAA